ncbi:MAG: transposase [Acidobacteriales bacterium]|nr:transposase [Terriglobales bacterium]
MPKRGHTEEEILRVLREAESGATVVCRQHGISQQSFYLWKKKYAGRTLSIAPITSRLAATVRPFFGRDQPLLIARTHE